MQRILNMAVLAAVCGCGGGAATVAPATHPAPAQRVEAEAAAALVEAPATVASAETEDESAPDSPDALPARVDAGSIPRATVMAVLSSGVGRFLQKVRAEPHLEAGHFVGWRLVSVFEGEVRASVLRPGDTVLSVNGKDIERPEQFKAVWDQVANQDELVLMVQRKGKRSELHYRIVQ